MQFVASPVLLMAFAAGLDPDAAFDGQVIDHLIQGHTLWAFQSGLALAGFGAGMGSTRAALAFLVGVALLVGVGRVRRVAVLGKTFAGFDGGGVSGDVIEVAVGKGDLDEGLVKDVRQISGGELGKGAGEGGLGGDLGSGLPPQRL